jgi:hypothetical protein
LEVAMSVTWTLVVALLMQGQPAGTPPGAPSGMQPGPTPAPAPEPAPARRAPGRVDPPRLEARPLEDVHVTDEDLARAVKEGLAFLVRVQEGDPNRRGPAEDGPGREWPYEGVYRVGGQIPIGYRVGGTGIVARALLLAPGYGDDEPRRAAVRRAAEFVCAGTEHPLMSEKDYNAGYDVRGWGYTYGLWFLLDLKARGQVPEGMGDEVERATRWYLDAIEKTQIPESGGWSYSRPAGRERPAPSSPFMTGPTLQCLALARRLGYEVNQGTIDRALDTLDASRGPEHTIVYSGRAGTRVGTSNGVPGATGRMCCVEATLLMFGRGDEARARNAVERFLEHWDELDKRRARGGTHDPPYGVAPYYFMFAHLAAAQCLELLPPDQREELRTGVRRMLFRVRSPEGTWNDRVFPRSAAFGTAFALLAIGEGGWPEAERRAPAPPAGGSPR